MNAKTARRNLRAAANLLAGWDLAALDCDTSGLDLLAAEQELSYQRSLEAQARIDAGR